MKFLLSGGSGFLGCYIHSALMNRGYTVESMGRSSKNEICTDITQNVPSLGKYDVFVHCAGKAHVTSEKTILKEDFFLVNVRGTQNILNALVEPPKKIVFISTVAVYGCNEGELINESHPLSPNSPYAISKFDAETVLLEWCRKRNVELIILRLPLIFGNNAPGSLGQMKKMIASGKYISIYGNNALKSWVLAEDIAEFIAANQYSQGIFNLTDGDNPSIGKIENAIANLVQKKIRFFIPLIWLKLIAVFGDGLRRIKIPFPVYTSRLKKLTSSLTFDDSLARRTLDWKPRSVINYILNRQN